MQPSLAEARLTLSWSEPDTRKQTVSSRFDSIQFQDEEEKALSVFGRFSRLFDFDHELIPPDPNFFSAGFFGESEDK